MTASNRDARLDEELFDRLVDGELSEEERSELLTRLDAEPALWRRCALAFLEAQTWREAIGEMVDDLTNRAPTPVLETTSPAIDHEAPSVSPRRRPFRDSRIAKLTAMAAGFAIAFLVGVWGHTWWLTHRGNTALDFAQETSVPPRNGVPASAAPAAPQVASIPTYSPYQWEWVTVPVSDQSSNKVETLSIPVIPRESPSEDVWCGILPTPLPPEIADILLQQGHEIRQHRELVPVSLPDGRQAVMPIDEYEVRFIRHKRFQ
ncbi:hypothetical protein JCM19992_11260 [Thermostilla marina]